MASRVGKRVVHVESHLPNPVDGAVPRRFLEGFSRVTVAGDAASTTLLADLAGMSELLDLFDELRRDGLVRMEVRRDRAPNPREREVERRVRHCFRRHHRAPAPCARMKS
jgi:hypothetical protein